MERRITALLLVFALLPACAGAFTWQKNTPGQLLLVSYVDKMNDYLEQLGEWPVNSLFEMYTTQAVFGITDADDAELPEKVEITAKLSYDSLDSLQLRVSDPGRFPAIAAACLLAMGQNLTEEQALREPKARAKAALDQPGTSYLEPVDDMNGSSARVYYAYFPNQYADGVNWLQMTIIFPIPEYWNDSGLNHSAMVTRAPDTWGENSEGYEGYFAEDDYTHFEVFTTATPEPDSAAAEYDPF